MGNIFYYSSNIGRIGIAEKDHQITYLLFEGDAIPKGYIIEETELLRQANNQLQEYFKGQRETFSLSYAPSGTEFMKKVWLALQDIPYGTTQSYKELAVKIDHHKAYRAVGLANNRNPIPIFIPCHRVIGANGKLVGYGGGLEIKSYLLELESKNKEIN